jgi:hypothetical protein
MSDTATTTTPADRALLAAEQEIAALRKKVHDLSAAGDADANLFKLERQISDNRARAAVAEEIAPLSREFGRLRAKLNKTAPTTLAGAIVKLRQLADPAEGIEQGPMKGDFKSLRLVLAFLEGEAAERSPISEAVKAELISAGEEASIAALVEKRFRIEAQIEETIRGLDLGPDDETGDKIVDAMSDAEGVFDQRVVDRIPATLADLAAQLRLYRILVTEGGTRRWADHRDHRLFRSMEEGLDAMAAKDGEAQP